MSEPQAHDPFARVVQKFEPDSTLQRTWALTGGVSAQVTALEVLRPNGETRRMIVRQHGATDLSHNPQIAADEYRLLRILHAAGLITPEPYYLDQSNDIFGTPYLVIEYIEGTTSGEPTNLVDLSRHLALRLAKIHAVDNVDLSFLPDQAQVATRVLRERPPQLDESLHEGSIRATLEAAWPWPQQNRSVLLHGDYWPGNMLWHADHLVAIIDWEDAKVGDPLADVANSRLEFLWAFGSAAMEAFTEHYRSMTTLDFTNLPYWDLYAALRPASRLAEWAGDAVTEARMRERHHIFITQAFNQLASGAFKTNAPEE